jgi:hypothetical protein
VRVSEVAGSSQYGAQRCRTRRRNAEEEEEAEPLTPDPAQLEAPGASTETDAAAAAAPAAFAPEGSTGGAAMRPCDRENESPNKVPLKKPSVVEHNDSDLTAQHLTFDAAAAPPAAAAE